MNSRWLVSTTVFLFSLVVGLYFIYGVHQKSYQEQQLLLSHIVYAEAASIERRLSHSLSATYILAQEVRATKGSFEHFNQYAADVLRWVDGVSNLQLAPQGVISQIYPLEGNEKAIGHNILKDDNRKEEALAAVSHRTLTLAGPFELIQGGVAIIGRNPVFVYSGEQEQFWGFTSALIFLDDLLASTHLKRLEAENYSFTLSKKIDANSAEENVFARSDSDIQGLVVERLVNIPNGQWILRVSQRPLDNRRLLILWAFCAVSVAIMLAFLTHRFLQEPDRLREQVNQKTKELNFLAFHDSLTGAASRRYLYQEMEKKLRYASTQEMLALLYIDLDDFKRINDSMGHDVGDYVLKEIVDRMKQVVSNEDTIARLGGDEFAILLSNVEDKCYVDDLAEDVLKTITQPVKFHHRELVVTASIGVALSPYHAITVTDLLLKADLALYASKNQGKNQSVFYHQSMQNKMITRVDVEEGIRQGILNDQFYLVFQPIVDLQSERVIKYEALIRWQHPNKGVLYPNSFIEIAEETGLIVDLGKFVLEKACEFINDCKHSNQPTPIVTINVSPMQFSQSHFVEDVQRITDSTGVNPHHIQLEITESVLMSDVENGVRTMQTLKDKGFLFLMDDFGTGYSSLSQLKQLPVNTLKIDRSFIRDIDSDKSDYQIVAAIVALAAQLNIDVVAEGIENEKQLALLRKVGCYLGQGYWFSRPVEGEVLLVNDTKENNHLAQ